MHLSLGGHSDDEVVDGVFSDSVVLEIEVVVRSHEQDREDACDDAL